MYFWKIDRLKHDLRNELVTEHEFLKYLIASTIIVGLALMPLSETNDLDMLSAGISIPIAVFGTLATFHVSNKRNFVAQFIAVTWVVGIRLIPAAILLLMLTLDSSSTETTQLEVAAFALVELIFYWRVIHHIKDIAQNNLAA
ncbi:hypothetical protein EK599_09895 [Vibrio sp. T187]|uniref:hypothetical protein n=1 Tax=Vibrio TaxID=662 RepID=UPI0010C9D894|nr:MULTISPECIES: hypothetical protein [Vibrio]MBW3696009.1 hypothetical protein [Vibrio sp. T187]